MTINNMQKVNVLITGATKGIGRAITERFAQAGANVAISARTQKDVENFHQTLEKKYPQIQVLSFIADMGNAEEVQKMSEAILAQWTHLDVLINNAGLFLQDDLLTEAESNLDQSLQVNVYGPYRLCRHLVPTMISAGKGHIINICSVASQQAFTNCGSYVISKHALLGLNRALRAELREKGVKVTAMLPGATWTASWEGAELPQERIMQPEDVAEAVFAAWKLGPSTLVEEMLLRPQLGDL